MKIALDEMIIFDGEISCAFSDALDEKSLGDVSGFNVNHLQTPIIFSDNSLHY